MINPLRSNGSLRQSAHVGARQETGRAREGFAGAVGSGNAARTSGASPMRPMAPLATLVAVQAAEERTQSRKRAVRRGTLILDELDALKLAVLEGREGQAELQQIARKVESARESSGDAELESLVDAIELRAQVEIAKRQRKIGSAG
ncbi:MAG: flagellar assembly regulator FliX [Rhizobiales bacterium]|nr:flagellar assembly regulator FliX [Hyphomicrobiales bacterium]